MAVAFFGYGVDFGLALGNLFCLLISGLRECGLFLLQRAFGLGQSVHLLLPLCGLMGMAVAFFGYRVDFGLALGCLFGLLISGLGEAGFFLFKRVLVFGESI